MQTFVLAQQPSGYFVLNDIYRYIKEESEEELEAGAAPEESAPAAQEQLTEDVEMPKVETAVEEPAKEVLDPAVVDEKLEQSITQDPQASELAPETNGNVTVASQADTSAPSPTAADANLTPEALEQEIEEEAIKEPEKPKDPLPTPSGSRHPTISRPSTQASVPAKPLSWANRAAAAAAAAAPTPRPAVPAPAPKTASPAQTQSRAPPAAPAAQPTPAPTPAAATDIKDEAAQQSGWQTAGSDNAKRQNRPQSVSISQEKEGTLGYVRNVTEAVKTEELRAALAKFGELVYFDINRQKVCLFIPTQVYAEANMFRTVRLSNLLQPQVTKPHLPVAQSRLPARISSSSHAVQRLLLMVVAVTLLVVAVLTLVVVVVSTAGKAAREAAATLVTGAEGLHEVVEVALHQLQLDYHNVEHLPTPTLRPHSLLSSPWPSCAVIMLLHC